jgi:hypothetical protein
VLLLIIYFAIVFHSSQGNPGLEGMMNAGPAASAYASQSHQGVSSSPAFSQQQTPLANPALEQPQSSPSAAGSLLGGGLSAPATTQQICSCITIHPAAPAVQQSPAASLAPATDSFAPSAASSVAQQQQQQTFSAPQQSFAAQQNSFVAPATAQQQQAYASSQQQFSGAQSAAAQSHGGY